MAGEVVIILIGPTRSGKTSFAKLAGCNVDGSGTTTCRDYQTVVQNRKFRIIDTPGLEDLPAANLAILKDIAQTLSKLDPFRVGGAIFFHRITDGRFGGTARSHLEIFRQICGPKFIGQSAFVTTMWNRAGPKGRDTYEGLQRDLVDKYFRFGPTFAFENKEESVNKVLEHFANISTKAHLQLAEELKRMGSSLSGVRKTSAGKEVLKAADRGPCVIL